MNSSRPGGGTGEGVGVVAGSQDVSSGCVGVVELTVTGHHARTGNTEPQKASQGVRMSKAGGRCAVVGNGPGWTWACVMYRGMRPQAPQGIARTPRSCTRACGGSAHLASPSP